MLTQIVTFLIFVAVIGCILYGRKLIKTEKVDAVFGNPERALGGTHWVIVGSSFLLLVWLYYSWDIAKGFYPKSANELCQVAKVNDSLLGLKYQFPIEERELKSTSQIKQENKNLKKISIEIQNSDELNSQQKTILVGFIKKTNQLIPLLTNEDLIENETKQKINDITGKEEWSHHCELPCDSHTACVGDSKCTPINDYISICLYKNPASIPDSA